MKARLKVNQTQRFGSGRYRLIESFGFEVNIRQLTVDGRIFEIVLERRLKQSLRCVQITQFAQGISDPLLHSAAGKIDRLEFFEQFSGFSRVIFQKRLAGVQPIQEDGATLS